MQSLLSEKVWLRGSLPVLRYLRPLAGSPASKYCYAFIMRMYYFLIVYMRLLEDRSKGLAFFRNFPFLHEKNIVALYITLATLFASNCGGIGSKNQESYFGGNLACCRNWRPKRMWRNITGFISRNSGKFIINIKKSSIAAKNLWFFK